MRQREVKERVKKEEDKGAGSRTEKKGEEGGERGEIWPNDKGKDENNGIYTGLFNSKKPKSILCRHLKA